MMMATDSSARLNAATIKSSIVGTLGGLLRSPCIKYLASADPDWEGVLKGGVYYIHKGQAVDESVMWGECFFIEALEEALRVIQ